MHIASNILVLLRSVKEANTRVLLVQNLECLGLTVNAVNWATLNGSLQVFIRINACITSSLRCVFEATVILARAARRQQL